MGGIWKPSGRKRYRLWYKDHNGQRQTAPGYTDKQASEAKLRKLEVEQERIAAGLVTVDHATAKKPLLELIAAYIADLKRQGRGDPHTAALEGFLKRLAKWEKWDRLAHIRHASMTQALVHLDENQYAPNSVNSYRKAWKGFLGWCVDNNYLDENPILRVKPSRGKERPCKRRAPTLPEWQQLIDTMPARRRPVYLVASLTGLRKGEVRALERRDINLDHDPPQLQLRAEATKSGRNDVVPLLPDAVPTLRDLCQGLRPTDRIFKTFPSKRTIRADIERAGIVSPDATGRHVTFHSLRYFYCVLIARRLPIQIVRMLMRHRDISTTCRIYMDLGLQDMNEEVLRLPLLLPAHPPAHNDRVGSNGEVAAVKG